MIYNNPFLLALGLNPAILNRLVEWLFVALLGIGVFVILSAVAYLLLALTKFFCRVVAYIVCGLWNRLLAYSRSSVFEPATVEYLEGSVQWGYAGPFVSCIVDGKPVRIRVSGGDLIELSLQRPSTDESMLPGSLVLKSSLPKYQVRFSAQGHVVGSGFRVTYAGQSMLLTAKHVLRDLLAYGQEVQVVSSSGNQHPLLREWKVLLDTSADLIGIEFPATVASQIGVSTTSVARCPAAGKPVEVYGTFGESTSRSTGVISKLAAGFRIHHSCSTTAGFSGAPLMVGGRVVGVHLSGHNKHNEALALDWLLSPKSEESDTREKGYRQEAFEEDPDNTFYARTEKAAYMAKVRGMQYSLAPMEYTGSAKAWADYEEDDEDWGQDDDFYIPRVESNPLSKTSLDPVKDQARVLTKDSAAASHATLGQLESSAVPTVVPLEKLDGSKGTLLMARKPRKSKSAKKREAASRKLQAGSGPLIPQTASSSRSASTQKVSAESNPPPKPKSKPQSTSLSDLANTLELVSRRLSVLEARSTGIASASK